MPAPTWSAIPPGENERSCCLCSFRDVHCECQHRLINEFLGFSILQTGKMHLNLSDVSVDKILTELCQAYELKAAESGLRLALNLEADMAPIEGDSVHLRRVFTNLLENAIKFSTNGGAINISTGKKQKCVAVTVRDEGPGIPPEELPYIFDPYHRWRIGERTKGFGLGLASVKAVVEAHGGRVLVESELGKGSRFTVFFPKTSDL